MADEGPPGEQPAQQPPQQPPQPQQPAQQPGAAPASGLDPKLGGLLAYLLFGWIGGLIMYLTQTHREVRFHGAQSVLFSIALFALWIVLFILSAVLGALIPFIWVLFLLIYTVVGLGSFVVWVFLCIKGYALEHFKLPVVGDMAEQWAAR